MRQKQLPLDEMMASASIPMNLFICYYIFGVNLYCICLSENDLVDEFKSKASSFKGSVRGLEDRAKQCESLKWLVRYFRTSNN